MKIKFYISILALLLFPLNVLAQGSSKSTADDQTGVEVTVYNSNLGLIKDTRRINLLGGQGELRFMDVASGIMPTTVHVKSLNHPDGFSVLEQNYEYDLISESKLLDKFVGKTIKLESWNQFQDKRETVEAMLLSNNQGQVYKINNAIYLNYPGMKILPEIPENLIAQPTLTWDYQNDSKGEHQLEVSYLTNNISWNADYVLVLGSDDSSADLSGWVTINNTSGASYKDAVLKLVAGEVNRVQSTMDIYTRSDMLGMEGKKMARAPQFEEKGFFEYHIYDLQRKTTIKNNQTKQISLLNADGLKTEKEFITEGNQNYWYGFYRDQDIKQPVNVYVKFKNSKDNHLGMPLPAGTMRLYKEDSDKKLQFIGEDNIKHTPKDEEVKLRIGEAFDVVVERKQTDYKATVNPRVSESEWEVTLRNHKESDVVVGVVEPTYGDWEVISKTHDFTKVDAFTIRFDVNVPKDGEVKIKYRVRVTY